MNIYNTNDTIILTLLQQSRKPGTIYSIKYFNRPGTLYAHHITELGYGNHSQCLKLSNYWNTNVTFV